MSKKKHPARARLDELLNQLQYLGAADLDEQYDWLERWVNQPTRFNAICWHCRHTVLVDESPYTTTAVQYENGDVPCPRCERDDGFEIHGCYDAHDLAMLQLRAAGHENVPPDVVEAWFLSFLVEEAVGWLPTEPAQEISARPEPASRPTVALAA
ncbi:MAG: hypothetical protein KKA73_03155 [Chloroflexi bacterium]|nr:hypothetical protein [Chloroflexota bacterium]